jgi:beta-phosphoglucomutase-like phosphatase (HAD superfamily)
LNGRGLFLDLDGTLADSLAALKGVYHSFLAGFGVVGNEAEFQRLNGPPLGKIVKLLKDAHNLPGEPAVLLERYSIFLQEAHQTAQPAIGAQELLGHARVCGWKVAVVTSSPRSSALKWLELGGLSDKVDDVVGGDEVSAGKPSAEPYLLALSRLGCLAELSHAVEDSRIGATASVAAGLNTFALAGPEDQTGWPDRVVFIQSLTDLVRRLETC